MNLTLAELQIIRDLDDGSLYAEPSIVSALFNYPHMLNPRLLVSRDSTGQINGYLPTGQYYADGTRSYIAAMPNSPPVSPTYTPGAGPILERINPPYFDTDVVANLLCCSQHVTASAYSLPLPRYFTYLSKARRKDFRRKLKHARVYTTHPGSLSDIRQAWEWMARIWDQRPGEFGSVSYADYLALTLDWLEVLQRSPRAHVTITQYRLNGRFVGVNFLLKHRYRGQWHCDDYLTWYDPERASGLGLVSALNNFTKPHHWGCRYNLGNPGVNGVYPRHCYKMALIPPALRLTQAVRHIAAN